LLISLRVVRDDRKSQGHEVALYLQGSKIEATLLH
jgi:hypothetical protein